MLSRRLTQKLEGLSGEALAHLEAQADALLAMPEHRRERRLHLVHSELAAVAASRAALAAATTAAERQQQLMDRTKTFVTSSRRLIASLKGKPVPVKATTRHLAAVPTRVAK